MANRLKHETSPYLLQHADNPVDWFPWSDEAFERARAEDKPIFLSIGYAACHWCHVMAHESFEDPVVAAMMNDRFINIKVDREERPDVDSIYMDAVVALTGRGGWPLSAFLTPAGKPFYGGTYFPPERRFNMPSFQEVLESIHKEWSDSRERVEQIGDQLSQHIQSKPVFELNNQPLEIAALDSAAEILFEGYDWANGGWGTAPKFPQATVIDYLLQRYQRKKDRLALDMAKHALHSMAQGGLYDQVGGGFHRYAVDTRWLVPHFEKMLYDNAVLIPAYLHAWQLTREDEFLRIVRQSWEFLFREMRSEAGAFYASLDADSQGEEGKFYIWTKEEIEEALTNTEDIEIALRVYGLTLGPNFEGANVLYRPESPAALAGNLGISVQALSERISEINRELLSRRSDRERPATDDKIITAWNGLVLMALAESARALKDEEYLDAARTLADFLRFELKTVEGWKRTTRSGQARHNATLRDLASVGLGFLALYETDFNLNWFEEVEHISAEIMHDFHDPDGGFFDTHSDQKDLIARPKTIQDTPIPSGNSLAVLLLLKMYTFTGDDRYAAPAEQALRGMQATASRHPTAFAGWLSALDYAIGPRLQLALLGDPNADTFRQFTDAVNTRFLPRLIRAGGEPGEEGQPALLHARTVLDGNTTAYLCQGFVCNRPTNSVDELIDQIEEAHKASEK